MKNNKEKLRYPMWWIVFGTMALTLLLFTLSCKKPKQSDSSYKVAYMFLSKNKFIYRNGTGRDSINNEFSIGAFFGDGNTLDVNQWREQVGNVSLSGINLIGLNSQSTPYYYHENNANDVSIHRLDNPSWEVVSPNGLTDMSFNIGNTAYYEDTLPIVIDRSVGFGISINKNKVINADSISIRIGWEGIDTVVSSDVDHVAFSPARLAVLSPDTNFRHTVVIDLFKYTTVIFNGRLYKIGTGRTVEWNINVQ